MPGIKVSTQEELNQAARAGEHEIEIGESEPLVFSGEYSPNIRLEPLRGQKIKISEDSAARLFVALRAAPLIEICGRATPRLDISGTSQPTIEVRDSAMPRIDIYGASQLALEAYDQAAPRVEISGSASLRAHVYGAAYPRIFAYGRSSIRYQGRGEITAGVQVPIMHDGKATISGGVQVVLPAIEQIEEEPQKDENEGEEGKH